MPRCPLWVRSRHLQCNGYVRFTPESRHLQCTSLSLLRANSRHSLLLDHLVGACKQCEWDCQAKSLRSLEVDYQLILGRRLHRKIGRLLALEDTVYIPRRPAVQRIDIRAIGSQPTVAHENTIGIYRRQLVSRRKGDD